MIKLVIILLLLALIGGGALSGLGLAGIGPLAAYLNEHPAEPAAAAPPEQPRHVDMETIGVPLFDGQVVRSRLFLNIQLVLEPSLAKAVVDAMPRMQDAILTDLIVYLPQHFRDRDKVDVALLQKRLVKVASKVAGAKALRDVAITHAFER